jgi:hypothetical protein
MKMEVANSFEACYFYINIHYVILKNTGIFMNTAVRTTNILPWNLINVLRLAIVLISDKFCVIFAIVSIPSLQKYMEWVQR